MARGIGLRNHSGKWLILMVGALLAASGAALEHRPVAVSPGELDTVSAIAGRCPTFSWGAIDGATSYELIVYSLTEAPPGESSGEALVLQTTVAGSALAWSPPLASCLVSGRPYAWSVRASRDGGDTDWSAPRLFRVSSTPSLAEVESAMDVLRRHLEQERSSGAEREAEGVLAPAIGISASEAEITVSRADDTVSQRGALFEQARALSTSTFGPTLNALQAPVLSNPSLALDGQIDLDFSSAVFMNGIPFLWGDVTDTAFGLGALDANTTGLRNVALGAYALSSSTSGFNNTAVGASSLVFNESGDYNTAVGYGALLRNESGDNNVAIGELALFSNTTGLDNTAVGRLALSENTSGYNNVGVGNLALFENSSGRDNVAVGDSAVHANKGGDGNVGLGHRALLNNTTGSGNVALGRNALRDVTGSRNIGIGYFAGSDLSSGSDNIFIGNSGIGAEQTGKIRIGTHETHNETYIAGIAGNSLFYPLHVYVQPGTGELGDTPTSSRRFKEDIHEMGEASEPLLGLRPVTFRYKKEYAGKGQPVRFGLIAEEVAELFPQMVSRDEEDRPRGVRYHQLITLLLNELQKQHMSIELQEQRLGAQEDRLHRLVQRLSEVSSRHPRDGL